MKVAIAHEKITGIGGAQKVAFELARTFDAPIYTGWVEDEYVPEDVEVRQLFSDRSKRLLNLPGVLVDGYHMLKWSWVKELYEYDTVILNKTNTAWFVPKPDQQIIHYVHSPPRSTFDRWHDIEQSNLNRVAGIAQRAVYEHTWNYPDYIIANSEVVAHRLERYLDREADEVIHPPVPIDEYSPEKQATDGFYFTVGRLAPNKNVPAIVEACEAANVPIKIAGEGPTKENVENVAGENTEVLGYISEERKQELYSEAKATIFNASQEDFGITPVESLASGTPVIGVNEGYTKYQVQDGKNGILFNRNGGENLKRSIEQFENRGVQMDETEVSTTADEYHRKRFRRKMQEVIYE